MLRMPLAGCLCPQTPPVNSARKRARSPPIITVCKPAPKVSVMWLLPDHRCNTLQQQRLYFKWK